MLLHALIVASALAPSPSATATAAPTAEATQGLDVVIVRAPERVADAVAAALRVRLPNAQVLPFANESFASVEDRAFVYVEVSLHEDPTASSRLLLVLSDGRAWVRDVPPDPDQPARAVATTIANTLSAIEEERLLPDRTEVEVPRPEPEPDPQPEPEPEPVTAPPPRAEPRESSPPPRELAPRAFVGVGAEMLGIFGLAPATPAARFPVGGQLRLAVRLPIGVTIEASMRGAGRARSDYRLLRLRGSVAAGYALSRGRLALGAVIGPTLEGWTLRDADGRVASQGPNGSRRPPLFGGALAVFAGAVFPPSPTRRVQVHIGGRAELSASALPSGSAARVLEAAPPERILFTAGGLEATLGLDVTLWLPIPRR